MHIVNGYAVKDGGWRAVTSDMELFDGEEFFEQLPSWSLAAAEAREVDSQSRLAMGVMMRAADQEIRPLQDALDIDEITNAESTRLIQLKRYRIALSKTPDRAGWPETPDWPAAPE